MRIYQEREENSYRNIWLHDEEPFESSVRRGGLKDFLIWLLKKLTANFVLEFSIFRTPVPFVADFDEYIGNERASGNIAQKGDVK